MISKVLFKYILFILVLRNFFLIRVLLLCFYFTFAILILLNFPARRYNRIKISQSKLIDFVTQLQHLHLHSATVKTRKSLKALTNLKNILPLVKTFCIYHKTYRRFQVFKSGGFKEPSKESKKEEEKKILLCFPHPYPSLEVQIEINLIIGYRLKSNFSHCCPKLIPPG